MCVCCARALSPVWDPRLPRASRRALSSFVSCLIIIIINTVFPSVAPPCRASPTRGGECAPCVRGVRPGEDALHDTRFPPAGRIFWSLSFVSVSACVCSRELCRVRCESVRLTCRLRRFESVGGTELSAFRALAFFFYLYNRYSVLVFSPSRVSSGSFESIRVLLSHEVPIFNRKEEEIQKLHGRSCVARRPCQNVPQFYAVFFLSSISLPLVRQRLHIPLLGSIFYTITMQA